MTYEDIVKQAFLEELGNIYAARGEQVDLTKFASDPRIDAMIKEARLMAALREGAETLGKKVTAPIKAVYKQVSPAQRQLTTYKELGVGDVAEQSLKQQNPLRRAEAWGKAQRQTPIQRVTAARKAATDPTERAMLTMKGPNKGQQIADITRSAEQTGASSPLKRGIGAAVEGGAAHARHHPGMMLVNPLGIPIGGAVEGATKQMGRELGRRGAQQFSGAQMGAGKLLRRHAGKIGTGAEVGALAGLGTAVHAPLSGAGIVGGKVLGGASAALPAIGEGLAHAGDVVSHGVQDVVGMATKKVPALAGKGVAAVKGLGSRMLGRAPQAVGA